MPSSAKPSLKSAHTSFTLRVAAIALCVASLLFAPCAPGTLSEAALLDARQQDDQNTQDVQRPRRATAKVEAEESDDVVRVDTDLVMLDATVLDKDGRPVRNLRAEDFKIYEDGVERPLSFFNVEWRGGLPRPLSVVFAVDVSGSMTAEEMGRLSTAMRVFSKRLTERPATFALMSFGMSAKVLQGFTAEPQKFERALARLAREENGLSTHTYDAVDDAIRLLARAAPRTRERRLMKRAVIVVTDGFPVGDTVSPKTVIERANASEVSIYAVTLPSYTRLLASASNTNAPLPTPLDVSGLTEKTGGTSIYATDKDFEPLFKALAEEVTSSYVLAFYPSEEKRRDGRSHSVRIEVPRGLYVRQSRTDYKSGGK